MLILYRLWVARPRNTLKSAGQGLDGLTTTHPSGWFKPRRPPFGFGPGLRAQRGMIARISAGSLRCNMKPVAEAYSYHQHEALELRR